MDDLEIKRTIKRGAKGKKVKCIQEWLCLHGFDVLIDGIFGPATEKAVVEFQRMKGITADGKVGKETYSLLVKPMKEAVAPIAANGRTLGQMICAYAEQHIDQQPCEVGGENRGPWVRLYMSGGEGKKFHWCAGFVSLILGQACSSLNIPLPIEASQNCDILAAGARQKGLFKKGSDIIDKSTIKPGSFFLNLKSEGDWDHTGIVIDADSDVFYTIEGNTNHSGNRNGYAALKRIRGYDRKDFIIF